MEIICFMKSFFQFYNQIKINEAYYKDLKNVNGYIDADDLINNKEFQTPDGPRVWVHTNRTHANNGYNGMIGIYQTDSKGRKAGKAGYYTNEIRLKSPILFQTSESSSKRIQANDKRELIAGVSGIVMATDSNISGMVPITYNPYGLGYFHMINPEKVYDDIITSPNKINSNKVRHEDDIYKRKIIDADEVYFNSHPSFKYMDINPKKEYTWTIYAKNPKFE